MCMCTELEIYSLAILMARLNESDRNGFKVGNCGAILLAAPNHKKIFV